MNRLSVVRLGRLAYREAHRLQQRIRDERIAGRINEDLLLLVEHEPTVTLGRGTRPSSLPLSVAALQARGLSVVEVERGGDVTWHGPGQLVGYPIIDLTAHRPDLHWYLRQLEAGIIDGLATLGIPAERNPGFTGVWTGGRKIASIGIHVRQWVTAHGFALNVQNDLADFDLIVPCGITGVRMTSVARERGSSAVGLWEEASAAMGQGVAAAFGLEPVLATPEGLLQEGTGAGGAA